MFDQISFIFVVTVLFSLALKAFWITLALYAFFALRQATSTLRRIAAAQEQIDHQLRALAARGENRSEVTPK